MLPNINTSTFAKCVETHETKAMIEQDVRIGLANGVAGTPTVFVNGYRLTGLLHEQLATYVRQLTARK